VEKREKGRKVRLEQVKDRLPNLDGKEGRIKRVEGRLGSIPARGGGKPDGLAGALSLWAIPITIAILSITQGRNVSFSSATNADRGRGVNTISTS
jgi:hypothetical protein